MIKKKCKQCGKEFTLSDSEIKFFNDKNLELPKRCNECRKENKENKNNKESKNNINNIRQDNNISNAEKGNSHNNNKKKKYTLRSIIAASLVVVLLIIGKVFNIPINLGDINIPSENGQSNISLEFRNETLWEDHFIKHGSEFGYNSKEEYLKGANEVVNSSNAKHKIEAEDGDEIYYDEDKNEIVFVSTDGYIRTYFKPSEGINYYNRQ